MTLFRRTVNSLIDRQSFGTDTKSQGAKVAHLAVSNEVR